MRFFGRRHALGGVLVTVASTGARLTRVRVELARGGQVVARASATGVGARRQPVILRALPGRRLVRGRYVLLARGGRRVLLRRAVRLG